MTLKAGTVCYIVAAEAPDLDGRVVTLTGQTGLSERGNVSFLFEPEIKCWDGGIIFGAESECLRPISDPDQPVDVTSDTDEPVTV